MNATAYEKSVARNYADIGEVDKLSRLINSYPDLKSEIVPSSGLGLMSHACSNISKRSVGSLLSSRTKKNNNTVKVIKLSTKNSNNSLDISDNAKEEDAITDAVSRHLFDHAKCMIQKSKLDKSLILKSIIKGAINLHPIIIEQQEEIYPGLYSITKTLDKVKNEQAHLQIYSMITEDDNCKIDKKFAVEDLGKLIFEKVIPLIVRDDGGRSNYDNLLQDYPSIGNKTTIFGKLAMDLFTISGSNFERYEQTVHQFPSASSNRINYSAMILESTKQTLLRVIKVSFLHKLIHNNPSEIHFQSDEELDNSIKLLEARLLYLINTCNKRSDKEENYTILLDLDDVTDLIRDIKFLTSTYTNNKEYSSSATEAAKDCVSNLAKQGITVKNLKTNFENDMAILACQINSILNNDIDITQIVPIISLVKQIDEKELVLIKFSDSEKELIKNNIKFDYSMNGYMSPKFNEVSNFQQFEKSLKYYEKTPEALSPILVLLKTAHDSEKISKLANNINTDYETIKSELCTLRNDYNEEKFEDEDNDVTKSMKSTIQSLNVKKTIVSNITYLANKINQALNISPIVSVLEEYNNNYQTLDIQHDYEQLVLGDSIQTIA
ncbi:ankyrin repeat-containing protein [Orientia tsutsugamushi str. Gilliam]|uniref:Ankyrin repeat-containing protein n=1 Tax=Orientia tsutsugamushi str. Gilliam TaxID=1359184 RepID=A0A2U3R137_ORITS|nr:hypothetical protein [Orientia tsutsugamushi]SPR06940.1 ankyrin repeat-containing protein [Orientia tsutsugamushi str. Gilliam]